MAGLLLVVSGPSGTGKGTVCKELVKNSEVQLSVSATTRAPRTGEEHGRDYFFLTEEEFVKLIEEDGFVEHVENFGKRYGTLVSHVSEMIADGKDLILEIDVQGGDLIKQRFPEAILIFLLPPSLKELEDRIRKRGTESEENISMRLSKALREIECMRRYDYFVYNYEISQAVEDIKSIIKAEHRKVSGPVAEEIINIFEEER